MAKMTKKRRQAIIDGYLAETGRNMFVPAEFIDWLAGQRDHEAYPWFYGKSDSQLARDHRIWMARRMISGLRIVAQSQNTTSTVVSVTTREYPAFISPVGSRRDGGGYLGVDPRDPQSVEELRRQGVTALRTWLSRYRGAFLEAGYDLRLIEEIAAGADADTSDTERVARSA